MYKKILFYLFIITIFSNYLYADKLKEIQKKGVIEAGVKYDFEPFGYLDEYGEVVGFDIDLLKYIANDLNVDIKFRKVTSKNRVAMLEDDRIDIVAASMTHTQKRDRYIDFSISYFFDGLAILTTKYIKVNHHFGFNGKKVGVILGSTSEKTFYNKVPKAKFIYFDNKG